MYPVDLIMFYLTPTENNTKAREMFEKNIFSVTRQLRYSQDAGKLALDLCVFINGLPVITFELKNQLTKQNTDDAVEQYKTDRDPRDTLFSFKRCMVHFALDDARVKFCTKLCGKDSWFLPFDKGNPEWIFAGIYSDEGITGTSIKRRDGFNKMIEDALAGKIEIKTAELIQFDFSGAA